jgi:hypothetical protein
VHTMKFEREGRARTLVSHPSRHPSLKRSAALNKEANLPYIQMDLRMMRIAIAAATAMNNGPDILWAAELCALANQTNPAAARRASSA